VSSPQIAAAAYNNNLKTRTSTPRSSILRTTTNTTTTTPSSTGSKVSGVAAMAAMGMQAIKLYRSPSPNNKNSSPKNDDDGVVRTSEEGYSPNSNVHNNNNNNYNSGNINIERQSSLEGESSDDLRCDNYETPTKDVRDPYPAWWCIGSC